MPKQDFAFSHRLRVRWSEVDRQDIVFNGHYLTYFDLAMTEYLRAMGFPYPAGLLDAGSDLFVVKAIVEYKASAHYDLAFFSGDRLSSSASCPLPLT